MICHCIVQGWGVAIDRKSAQAKNARTQGHTVAWRGQVGAPGTVISIGIMF